MSVNKPICVNQLPRSLDATEPRTMLSDFLRENLGLTGTHLGCEHGICGACTVTIDGEQARSCITLAHACAGADIMTIEGYDQDPLMERLRQAFTEQHALQCGYCTPGMLIAARDLILRNPQASEHEIRLEMSGNLCRCTGYMGIVSAIQQVMRESIASGFSGRKDPKHRLGPVGSGRFEASVMSSASSVQSSSTSGGATPVIKPAAAVVLGANSASVGQSLKARQQMTEMDQEIVVDFPINEVWDFFGEFGEVATCLPGLSVLEDANDNQLRVRLRVKVGPIVAEFEGDASVHRSPETMSAEILGAAKDRRSNTVTQGQIIYNLLPERDGRATRIKIRVGYALAGSLAQFSRGSIVQDIAKKLTDAFASNLSYELARKKDPLLNQGHQRKPQTELNAGSVILSVLLSRMRNLVAAVINFFKVR